MQVSTRIPALSDGGLAWWVKCTLDGMALGCAPMWAGWRLPPLYASGVVFQLEPNHGSGEEDFAQPPTVYARGWGDCDDLINYRLTELLAAQLPAGFHTMRTARQTRVLMRLRARMGAGQTASTICRWEGGDMHVLVRLANGREEDPSIILGAPQ